MNKDAPAKTSPGWWEDDFGEPPLLLAIDSSSRTGSLAVLRGHAVVAEASWTAHGPGGSLHLDLATRLLADHRLTLADVGGVVVATGPGSFTGIRAGMSVGQGLAESLSIPLHGVSTLEALVAQMSGHARPGDLVCAIIGAGRGAVHAWTAVVGDGSIASCGEPVTATVQDVAVALGGIDQTVDRRVIIGGEIDAHQARVFVASMPGAVVLPPAATQRRAAWLVVVMRQAIDALSHEDIGGWFPEKIQPIYLLTPTGARPASLGWRLP